MESRFILTVIIAPEIIGLERFPLEAAEGCECCFAVLPEIDRNVHRIEHIGHTALHGEVEQAEIARLMSGKPVADIIDQQRIFPEDNDVGHVIPGLLIGDIALVGAAEKTVAVTAVHTFDNTKAMR